MRTGKDFFAFPWSPVPLLSTPRPGREVDREDIIRGYEKSKGEYIPVEPEELEAVAIESKRTIEIDQFVDRKEIDELYFGNPYYIVPDGEAGMRSDLALCRSRASVW